MNQMDIVLVCPGPGGGGRSNPFRPDRDESMWWNRRDALVRCVAATFCGHNERPHCRTRIRLVLVFDDDGARIDITRCTATTNSNPTLIPTERNVITILQQAAAGQDTKQWGLDAVLVRPGSNSITSNNNTKRQKFTTKRELLAYLHGTCDGAFLRNHHLNSSMSALLKKTNLSQLQRIHQIWQKQQLPTTAHTSHEKNKALQATIRDLLTPTTSSVVLLHESAHAELPVWNNNHAVTQEEEQNSTSSSHIILCLGAVRDMTRYETSMVHRLVQEQQQQQQQITCQRVRLGPVPEFTSKILSLVAWHAAYGVWGTALKRMKKHVNSRQPMPPIPQSTPTQLHVLCYLPQLASTDVTADVDRRTPLLWQLVRCLVVTLWRSKIHSSTAAASAVASVPLSFLENIVHLVFGNGVTVSLRSEDFVGPLAVQHQAAPTEHQVLQALVQRLESGVTDHCTAVSANEDNHSQKTLRTLVQQIREDAPTPLRAVVLEPDNNVSSIAFNSRHKQIDLGRAFYQSHLSTDDQGNVTQAQMGSCLACVCLPDENIPLNIAIHYGDWEDILSDSDLIRVSLDNGSSVDVVAATLTFLQHAAYQQRWPSTFSKAMEQQSDDSATTSSAIPFEKTKKFDKRKKKRRRKH